MTVERIVKFSAQLSLVTAFMSDGEVFDDADVFRCRIRVPAPMVEVDRRIAKECVIVVVPTCARLDDRWVEGGVTRSREVAWIKVFLETVLDVIAIGTVGKDSSLISPEVIIQSVRGKDRAHGQAAAVGSVESKCPAAHEIVQS